MNKVVGPAGDLDVVDMGVVADHQLERGVDLVACGRVVAFDQHDAGALLDHHQRAGEHRSRPVAGRGEHQMDRPLDRRALGDVDQRAIAHQRGVERDHALLLGGHDLAEISGGERIARGQRLGHGPDGQSLREIVEVGQIRRKHAVDEHDAPHLHVADQLAGVLGALLGGLAWRTGQRLGVAHKRAEIGVVPLLDPPVRQARSVEALERRLAQRPDRAIARELAFGGSKGLRQRKLGVALHREDFGIHDASAASPWNCA